MFSSNSLNLMFREVIGKLCGYSELREVCMKDGCDSSYNQGNQNNQSKQSNQCNQSDQSKISINPSQALVIAGILGGVLDVNSILVDKDQRIEILLVGSLKQKTQLEKIMDQIGKMPFDDVLNALLGRLK